MKNYKLEILESNSNEWDNFLLQSSHSTLFHTTKWTNILKKALSISSKILILRKEEDIIAGITIYYKKKFGLKIITKPPLTLYNGLIYCLPKNQKKQKVIEEIYDISEIFIKYLKKEYSYINFTTPINYIDVRPFQWNGWLATPQYTFLLPISNKEQIWNDFSSSLRRKIKNNESEEYKVEKSTDIEKLIDLHFQSYSHNKLKPIMDSSSFYKLIELAISEKICDIYTISRNNEIYSIRAVLKWKEILYDWIAGTATNHRDSNFSHLLLWELFKLYSDEGSKLFDFMGANTKTISDFKRLFGGELKEYYDLTYYSSSFIKLLFKFNNFVIRKVRQRG